MCYIFSRELDSGQFDAVVTESRPARTDGLSILRAVKARRADCPVIMVTASEADDLAVAAVWTGLEDFVVSTPRQPRRLATAVRSAVESTRERATQRWIQETIRQSDPGARALLDAAPEGIVSIDESGRIETINLSGARHFGYPAADLIGTNVGELMLPPRHLPGRADDQPAGLIQREPAGLIQREPGGLGVVRDVTERHQAEGERRRLVEREQAALAAWRREATEKSLILDQMLEAVIVTDREGHYTLVNTAAGRLLGMEPKDLVGLGIGDQPWQTFDETGELISHERRPLVGALRGERASGVAHDLIQSLGQVAGYGDLFLEALEQPSTPVESVRESIETMVGAAVDGAEVVRRLLVFARPTVEGPAERVDLADVMRDVLKLTQPKWRDASQLQGRPIFAELLVDGDVAIDGWPAALREALANLVLNAVDALPNVGTVR